MDDVHYWQVPGRVTLAGEHLDYNGGPVLPIAVDPGLTLKARGRDDGRIRLWSTYDGQRANTGFAVGAAHDDVEPWARYVAAGAWALTEHGQECRGADIVIESAIPAGAGLASSAAVTCGVIAALDALAADSLDAREIADLGRRAESEYAGVPVGAMDHIAVTSAGEGSALVIETGTNPVDIAPLETDWTSSGLDLVVITTGARRALTGVEYRQRRHECQQAADALGLRYLSRAGPDAVVRLADPVLAARARHVFTETARVRGAVKALTAGEFSDLAAMFTASHASLRDDFEVSCAELDLAVDSALEAGAAGARMTGAGFGGSVIALVAHDSRDAVQDNVIQAFHRAGWTAPQVYTAHPARGLHRVPSAT